MAGMLVFLHPSGSPLLPWILFHVLFVGLVAWALRAHPATVLLSAALAPLTATVGWMNIGIVALVVELVARRPGREEWTALTESSTIKEVLTNVWVRLILLFFLTNFAGGLATFATGPWMR